MRKENAKTLPTEVFDKLASPRLIEYWEQDPCTPPEEMDDMVGPIQKKGDGRKVMSDRAGPDDLGVTVEAKFSIGEYEVVILSARDSGG